MFQIKTFGCQGAMCINLNALCLPGCICIFKHLSINVCITINVTTLTTFLSNKQHMFFSFCHINILCYLFIFLSILLFLFSGAGSRGLYYEAGFSLSGLTSGKTLGFRSYDAGSLFSGLDLHGNLC